MESNAKASKALSIPQYNMGCDLVRALNLSEGDKVLDIGCGTGELTKFIADIVGQKGEVVGVDPNEARIKLAQEQFEDVKNVKFVVGDSVTGFPHHDEEYYDLHFSNGVFHWVIGDEKRVFVQKAYQCLKPNGRIALRTLTKDEFQSYEKLPIDPLTELEYVEMLQDGGLFIGVKTEVMPHVSHFASFEEMEAYFKGSANRSLKETDPDYVKHVLSKYVKEESDGRVQLQLQNVVRIIARKNTSSLP